MQDLFAQTHERVLVLGVGALGGAIACAGAADAEAARESLCAQWGAVHTESAPLLATGLELKLHIPLVPGPFAERGAWTLVAGQQAELGKLAAGRAAVLFCGDLNESSVRALVPPLCREFQNKGVFVAFLSGEPDASAENCSLDAFEKETDLFVTLASGNTPPQGPGRQSRQCLEKRLLAAAEALAGVLARGCNGAEFNPVALRGALGRGRVHGGVGLARGAQAPLHAVDAAVKALRPAFSEGKAPGNIAAALLSERELSPAEEDALAAVCRNGWTDATVQTQAHCLLGHATLDVLDGEALCLLLARPNRHEKVIRLSTPALAED